VCLCVCGCVCGCVCVCGLRQGLKGVSHSHATQAERVRSAALGIPSQGIHRRRLVARAPLHCVNPASWPAPPPHLYSGRCVLGSHAGCPSRSRRTQAAGMRRSALTVYDAQRRRQWASAAFWAVL
jgi:hypothetical protein